MTFFWRLLAIPGAIALLLQVLLLTSPVGATSRTHSSIPADPTGIVVSGTVTNTDGDPIAGVTVTVTDTTGQVFTTVTTSDGGYSIESRDGSPLTAGAGTVAFATLDGHVVVRQLTVGPESLSGVDVSIGPDAAASQGGGGTLPGRLAATGSSSTLPLVIGLSLIVIGGVILGFALIRRPTRSLTTTLRYTSDV